MKFKLKVCLIGFVFGFLFFRILLFSDIELIIPFIVMIGIIFLDYKEIK